MATRKVATRKPVRSEHADQSAVISHLMKHARPDVYFFAIPNAGRRGFRTAAMMKAEGLRAGVADICIMLPGGETRWLELKRAKGRQSDEQLGFAAICIRLGHSYSLARSYDEAVMFLDAWGVLKPKPASP
jgi:hypothetical protein